MQLIKNTYINQHIIELIEDKQSFWGSIYSLSLVELEILKAYIETQLKTLVIKVFEFFANVSSFLMTNLIETNGYILIIETSIT